VFIGAVFSFAFRLAAGTGASVGRSVAAVYSWNTVGSMPAPSRRRSPSSDLDWRARDERGDRDQAELRDQASNRRRGEIDRCGDADRRAANPASGRGRTTPRGSRRSSRPCSRIDRRDGTADGSLGPGGQPEREGKDRADEQRRREYEERDQLRVLEEQAGVAVAVQLRRGRHPQRQVAEERKEDQGRQPDGGLDTGEGGVGRRARSTSARTPRCRARPRMKAVRIRVKA